MGLLELDLPITRSLLQKSPVFAGLLAQMQYLCNEASFDVGLFSDIRGSSADMRAFADTLSFSRICGALLLICGALLRKVLNVCSPALWLCWVTRHSAYGNQSCHTCECM